MREVGGNAPTGAGQSESISRARNKVQSAIESMARSQANVELLDDRLKEANDSIREIKAAVKGAVSANQY